MIYTAKARSQDLRLYSFKHVHYRSSPGFGPGAPGGSSAHFFKNYKDFVIFEKMGRASSGRVVHTGF